MAVYRISNLVICNRVVAAVRQAGLTFKVESRSVKIRHNCHAPVTAYLVEGKPKEVEAVFKAAVGNGSFWRD